MTASVRQSTLSILTVSLFLACVSSAYASPLSSQTPDGLHFLDRRGALVTYNSTGGIQNVTNSVTNATVAQGDATDGSGVDFNVSAIIWLAWSFAVGVPLMFGGIALSRLTTGAGIGLAVTVCLWASFANTVNARGVPDLVITLVSLGGFVIGFVIGLFEVGHIAGITTLSFLGGFSIGARIVLFRPNLLIHTFYVNWLIITLCGLLGFLLVIAKQRAAITICSAAVGTFMTDLGIDLVVNKQAGMSFGLRYLFDRNSSHLEYLVTRGWNPPVSTEVIMAISLALIPALAYGQHRVFKSPFKRVRTTSISSLASIESASQSGQTTPSMDSSKLSPNKLEKTQVVDLNSTHERLAPTPEPSINSLAKLLPQPPPK